MCKETNSKKVTIVKQDKRNYFALYNKVFNELSKYYPKLFIKNQPLLLKVGIHRDIFKDYKLSVSKVEIRKFLYRYVRSYEYQTLHIENRNRYDLLGEKSGIVTKEHISLPDRVEEEKRKKVNKEKVKNENTTFSQERYNKLKPYHFNKPKLGLNFR